MAPKFPLQIVAAERRHGLQQVSLRIGIVSSVCYLAEHVRSRSGEAYKYVRHPQRLVLQSHHSVTQSRAGLAFEVPDKFFRLTPTGICGVLTSIDTSWT